MLVVAEFRLFFWVPTDRRGINEALRAAQCGQAGAFGIPLVPTHEYADGSNFGLKNTKSLITRCEIELFVIERVIGNVHLAVAAQIRSIGIEHDSGVVIKTCCTALEK